MTVVGFFKKVGLFQFFLYIHIRILNFIEMKKTLILIILALIATFTVCKPKENKFDCYTYFSENPSYLQVIVNAENNKSPLAVQEYNKIKNNVVKIEFKKLTITHGTSETCKGYFTTVWTIRSEYFSEEEYEYLIPCKSIRYNPKNDYTIWQVEWPQEHPFADKL